MLGNKSRSKCKKTQNRIEATGTRTFTTNMPICLVDCIWTARLLMNLDLDCMDSIDFVNDVKSVFCWMCLMWSSCSLPNSSDWRSYFRNVPSEAVSFPLGSKWWQRLRAHCQRNQVPLWGTASTRVSLRVLKDANNCYIQKHFLSSCYENKC